MKFTLYRRMSVLEAEKTLSGQRFYLPDNEAALQRKWFSTSLFRTHYFKSPFYNGESVIIKVLVNEDYFKKIFSNGRYILREPNGFYGAKDYDDDILFANAHKTISDLYNVGISNLEPLNEASVSISLLDDSLYCDILQDDLLGYRMKDKKECSGISSPYQYYVQLPFDVAVLALKYQTILVEGINPIIKRMNFNKSLDELKKDNLNKFKVTFKITFREDIKRYSSFNEYRMALDSNQVLKFAPLISSVEVVEVLDLVDDYKDFLEVTGDNLYTKHETKKYRGFERLDFKSFQGITMQLLRSDFSLDSLSKIIPNIKDVENVNQVDPKHIDNLKTHMEKVIKISNFVLNYFKNQGLELMASDIVLLKWLLLCHDLGKPYCECNNISSRYSQFGEKGKYFNLIVKELLDPDVAFDVIQINKIFGASSFMKEKKLKVIVDDVISSIMSEKMIDKEDAYRELSKYLKVAFLAKISHTASLKTRAFCASYVDDIQFFDRINSILLDYKCGDFSYDYDDLYYSLMDVYNGVVENFYIDKIDNVRTVDMIRGMVQSDYNDLIVLYNDKNSYVHHVDDSSQYCFDEIINHFFGDDLLILKYLSDNVLTDLGHGNNHSQRVGVLSYIIGKLKGLDDSLLEILLIASKYHDTGRVKSSKNHALESLKLLKEMNLSNTSMEYVYYLVEAHEYDDTLSEKVLDKYESLNKDLALILLKIFKDADALDRVRFDSFGKCGSVLNTNYLRNAESHKLIKFAYMLVAKYKENKKEIDKSIMKLIKSN